MRKLVDAFVDLVDKLAERGRLAGVARRLASDELRGDGDAELGGLLRPYIDPASCWSDERSWARLGPAS